VLESRITPILIINLLWKVHQDSRQFFTYCERWDSGELLPRSVLDHTVRELVADINISLTMTCDRILGDADHDSIRAKSTT
jgi:hypothetical protein